MIIEMFNFLTCDFYKFKTDVGQPGTMLPEPNKLVPWLDPKQQYTISIDGSSNSSGVVISEIQHKFPLYLMNVIRDSNVEMTYFEYADSFFVLLSNLLSRRTEDGRPAFRYAEVESAYSSFKRGVETYKVLKSQFDKTMKIIVNYGVTAFSTSPQAWKSWYLMPVKTEWNLKFNRSNKAEVRRYGIRYLESYSHIKNDPKLYEKLARATSFDGFRKGDVWDALGIDRFLFGSKIVSSEATGSTVINIGTEMLKTRKKVYTYTFLYDKNNEEAMEEKLKSIEFKYRVAKKLDEDANVQRNGFIGTSNMSLEDNIRVMAAQVPTGIYYAIMDLTINIIPELYNKNIIDRNENKNVLKPTSKILLVGHLA